MLRARRSLNGERASDIALLTAIEHGIAGLLSARTVRLIPAASVAPPAFKGEDASLKVAILAGGLRTRLAEETEVKPKPMVEIARRSILCQ